MVSSQIINGFTLHVGLLANFSRLARSRLAGGQQSLLQPPVDGETVQDIAHTCNIVQNVAKRMLHAAETMQAHDRSGQQTEAVRQCAEFIHMGMLFMLKSKQEEPVAKILMHDLHQLLSSTQGVQVMLHLAHQLQQGAQITSGCLQQYCSTAVVPWPP